MPSLSSFRPASASSLGDLTSWLAVLQSELTQARSEFQHELQHWETSAAPRPVPPPEPAADAWRRLTARCEQEAETEPVTTSREPALPTAVPAASPAPPPPPPAAAEALWYHSAGAHVLGPFTGEEMRRRLREGVCAWETPVWSAAQGQWQPARASLLAVGAGPLPPPPPPPPPPPAPPPPPPVVTAGARRFCHACGAAAEPTDRFCAGCGVELRRGPAEIPD